VRVTNDEVCAAIKDVFDDTRSVMEPAGALSVAGLKSWAARGAVPSDQRLVAILSGANMNFDRLRFVAERAELGEGREALLAVTIPERPGAFRAFCAALGACVVTEFNYRLSGRDQAEIFVGIATATRHDGDQLAAALRGRGYETADLSGNEMAKLHVRHMVGGRSSDVANEQLCRFEFPERPGALMAFLEQLTDSLRFAAEKKGLLTEFVLGASQQTIDASRKNESGTKTVKPLYYVKADPDRLREVITNIFDNAVKYTDSGKVTIGLTGDNQVVQFYVKDTGPGIPAEDIPHLFQKFYRVDNSTTRTIGGTGLGLFISRKIIELYQGRIWVESAVNKGSTFFINLPRLSTADASQLQAAEAQKAELQPITSLVGS